MIDIHCHILPGIDDGAQDVKEALEMIAMQRSSNVDAMYLTPHFDPEERSIDAFLTEREGAWTKLAVKLPQQEHDRLRLGAEVRYCEQLLSLDLHRVTLGESGYLLMELPQLRYPAYAARFLEELMGQGLIPVLAHVERCAYFREEPKLLKRLIDLGALAQVSAGALFDKRDRGFSLACLRHHLAQMVASDAHSITGRKPCMELMGKLPEELRQLHDAFSRVIWVNEAPPYIRATVPKRTVFGYR